MLILKLYTFCLCRINLSNDDNNNVRSEVKIGRGDIIEVFLSQDDVLLTLSNHLPVEMTLHTTQSTLK